jgi:hypothetical protein
MADKDYHQQKAPVPGQCLESRFRTLPSEKVITQVRIGIGYSEEGWWREAERAAQCQNHLLTFRVEPISPGDDLAYFLGADQWVDGFTPLPPSQHFPVLIQHARKLLMRAAAEERSEEKAEAAPGRSAHFQVLRHPVGSLSARARQSKRKLLGAPLFADTSNRSGFGAAIGR